MSAGPWYKGSGIGDANIAIARKTIELALNSAEKNREVVAHPVIAYALAQDEGLGQLMGELAAGISFVDAGQLKMAAVAEGTEATPSDYTSTAISITPARRAVARKHSDFAISLQGNLLRGEIGPSEIQLLTYDAFMAWASGLVDSLVAHATSASASIGTSGAGLTYGALRYGILQRRDAGVSGRGLCLLKSKGANDLISDMLSLGGAVAQSVTARSLVDGGGVAGSYVTTIDGVDVHLCSEIDASGGDDVGLLAFPGGLATKHQRVPLGNAAMPIADLGMVTIEGRRPGGGVTVYESATYNGTAIRENARIAKVLYATS